jgi:hypothetical protein
VASRLNILSLKEGTGFAGFAMFAGFDRFDGFDGFARCGVAVWKMADGGWLMAGFPPATSHQPPATIN